LIQVIPFTAEHEPHYLPLLARGLSDLSALRLNAVEIQAQINMELQFAQWDQRPVQTEKFIDLSNERELWFSGNLCGNQDLSLTLILYDPMEQSVLYRNQFQVTEDKFLVEWENCFLDLLHYLKSNVKPVTPRMYTKSLEAFLSFRKGLEILAQAKTSSSREEGLENLLEAVAYDPEFDEAIDILLLFLIQNDLIYNFDFSISILERLRQISNKHPRIPLVLAETYSQLGKFDKTEELLIELTAVFPKFVDGWVRLALFYNSNNKMDQALQALKKALCFEPDNATVLDLLGAIYVGAGDRKQAEKMWLKALESDPSRVNILINLALLAEEKNNLPIAENYYRQAVQSFEDWWGAFFYYGSFCQRQKRYEEAVHWLGKAAAKNNKYFQIYQNLAMALLELGRYDEAQESLLYLLKLAPDNTIRRHSLQLLNQLNNPSIKAEMRIRRLGKLWESGKQLQVFGELLTHFWRGKGNWFYWYMWSKVAKQLRLYPIQVLFQLIGLRLQPGFALLKELGLYYCDKGNYQKSLSLLRQAFKLHRNDPEINQAYFQTLNRLGRLEELRFHVRDVSE
jgi:tetratricopeptide (TPR) repeat protein